MSYTDIPDIAKKNSNLPYAQNEHAYGVTIKIAYDKNVLPNRYSADGDHLQIDFDKSNPPSICTLEYNHVNEVVFEYVMGRYYDLKNGDTPGLYIRKGYKKDGKSGVKNDFVLVNSKEEQLNYIMNKQHQNK